MKQLKQLTCIIKREGEGYVSLCPQIDIASQGDSVEEARKNLIEAIKLFFEMASPQELLKLIRYSGKYAIALSPSPSSTNLLNYTHLFMRSPS